MERLFNPATTQSLQDELSKNSDSFRAQQVHQKFESGLIKELAVDQSAALVSVEGQVFRHGVFEGKAVDDSKPVTVFLRLAVNTDMAHNGRYPLVVVAYDVRFQQQQ